MVEESQDAWKEKQGAAKGQQQRLPQPPSVTEGNCGGNVHSGSIFNGPISGRNVIAGTHVAGGTTNFNFS
jgi:hypothetical protein